MTVTNVTVTLSLNNFLTLRYHQDKLDLIFILSTRCGKAFAFIQLFCDGIAFVTGQGDSVRITEGLCSDIFDHPVQGITAVPASLHRLVDHHVPDIVFRNIIVIDHHDIADHLPFRIDPEGLTLVPVHIRLRKAPYQISEKITEKYSLESYDTNVFTKTLFSVLDRRILNLSPDVKREFKKLYVAYKLDTNFVDIVFQKQKLRISVNMKFSDVLDPNGICRDITNLGRWGNGDVEIYMERTSDVDQIMEIIEQSYRIQLDE